jgi:predicted DsbA family dithiol-disulfide isomerase
VYVYIDIVTGFCFTLSAIVKKKLHAYVYVYSLYNLVGFGEFL